MEHTPNSGPDGPDEVLAALADRDRRIVLDHLRESTPPAASVDELARALEERGPSRDAEASVVLHHAALPRLAETGVVEYDPDSGTVRYRENELLEALLDAVRRVTGPD